jgi:hypothetical protein
VTLSEKLVALHRALATGAVDHAFGGAIALAFSTLNPRGTSDIDVNVFVPAGDAARVLRALPDGVEIGHDAAALIARDGQIRLWWDRTPVDLFFSYAPVHDDAAAHRRVVGYEGVKIPVLGPVELAVFKVMFDRTRDWGDLEEMAAAGTLDVDAIGAVVESMVGPGDQRLARLAALRGA